MAEVKYYDPNTFEEKNIQIDDFIVGLMNQIYDTIKLAEGYSKTKIISNGEENKLRFGIFSPREPGDPPAQKYRITIDKMPPTVDLNTGQDNIKN